MLFLPSILLGQEDFRETYTLKGTTVLTGSDKNALSDYVYGYRLTDITSSECQIEVLPEGTYNIEEKVTGVSKTDSS